MSAMEPRIIAACIPLMARAASYAFMARADRPRPSRAAGHRPVR